MLVQKNVTANRNIHGLGLITCHVKIAAVKIKKYCKKNLKRVPVDSS